MVAPVRRRCPKTRMTNDTRSRNTTNLPAIFSRGAQIQRAFGGPGGVPAQQFKVSRVVTAELFALGCLLLAFQTEDGPDLFIFKLKV
jgi:hypothetical protein